MAGQGVVRRGRNPSLPYPLPPLRLVCGRETVWRETSLTLRNSLSGLALAASLVLAGCGGPTLVDTAVMPLNGGGTPLLSDQGAIQYSAYVLGSPGQAAGKPGDAARALASIDYLAGALYSNPHWTGFPAITKQLMLQGRAEVRRYLAVAPGTPSQVVVTDLLRAAAAFEGQDVAAAKAALPASVFTLGPDRTTALLTNMPPLPQANVAAQQANYALQFGCGLGGFC